MQNIE